MTKTQFTGRDMTKTLQQELGVSPYSSDRGLRFNDLDDALMYTTQPDLQDHMNPYKEQVGGDHYRNMKIQPMQFCMENGLDFATSNVIKYVVRKKGDKEKRAEDLRKAIQCIHIIAAHEGIEL